MQSVFLPLFLKNFLEKKAMVMTDFNSKEYLSKVDAWWRAANYISVAQMYLKDNPLMRREVTKEDVKVHPIGHWGTIAGQNFIYAHLNRVINKYDLNMFYIEGLNVIHKLHKMKQVLKNFVKSSHSLAVLHHTLRQKHQDLSTKVVNLVMLFHMPQVLSLIILM